MAKGSIISIINDLVSKRLKSLSMTDVVVGTITSISPYSITILKELNEITIPEELIDIDTIPSNAKVGDQYRFLRYNDGSRFLALVSRTGDSGNTTPDMDDYYTKEEIDEMLEGVEEQLDTIINGGVVNRIADDVTKLDDERRLS